MPAWNFPYRPNAAFASCGAVASVVAVVTAAAAAVENAVAAALVEVSDGLETAADTVVSFVAG